MADTKHERHKTAESKMNTANRPTWRLKRAAHQGRGLRGTQCPLWLAAVYMESLVGSITPNGRTVLA